MPASSFVLETGLRSQRPSCGWPVSPRVGLSSVALPAVPPNAIGIATPFCSDLKKNSCCLQSELSQAIVLFTYAYYIADRGLVRGTIFMPAVAAGFRAEFARHIAVAQATLATLEPL